jgi:hypothetical protein
MDIEFIDEAFQSLMGINGDSFVGEIIANGNLSERSYNAICDNIQHNSMESIIKYFGVVHYYYLQGK